MKGKKIIIGMLSGMTLFSSTALAAVSVVNNNVRLFEDVLWLIAFTLMIYYGFAMKNMSSGKTRMGYILLAITGISGWFWKGLGLAKRMLLQKEPKWLWDITRETFEGLTGILLAISFILLIYSLMSLFKKK